MTDYNKILQLIQDTNAKVASTAVEPSTSLATINEDNKATAALNLIKTTNSVMEQPEPKTYEDLAKIVKIQAQAPPAYEPMGTMEYLTKKVVGLVEQPLYALGEGSAAALETGAKLVGLKGMSKYFKESKEMWKTPPITKEVNEQFAWLLESANKKSTMHGMVVEMAEIGVQIGSLLIQMGLLGKVPGVKAMDLSVFKGTAPLKAVTKQMGTMFAHGVATTPGDLSNRFAAGVTRMAYNMTPYIANWTGATGWSARLVDTALNTFLTSPSYIKSMKAAKNPQEFIMMAMPQFMTDVIFALNTTGTPMNQRLKAMGARPVVFGQKVEEKTAFLKGVDKAIAETERPYGEEAPEPTKQQVVDSAVNKAKVQKAEEGVLGAYKEPTKDIYRFAQLSPAEQFRATIEGKKPAFLTNTRSPDYAKELKVAEELGMKVTIGKETPYGRDVVICPAKNKATATKILNLLKKPDFSPKYYAQLGKLLGYSKTEIDEFLTKQPAGAIVPSKLKPRKITVGEKPTGVKKLKFTGPEWRVNTQADLEKLGNEVAKAVRLEDLKVKWNLIVDTSYGGIKDEIRGYAAFGPMKDGRVPITISLPRIYGERPQDKVLPQELVHTIYHELVHVASKFPTKTFKEMHPKEFIDWQTKHEQGLFEQPAKWQPGVILTKTESKKVLARRKKAVADAKMDTLLDPINKGRKLSDEQQVRVVTENKDLWGKFRYGWDVLHLGNMRPERLMEELDGYRQGPNTKLMYGKINEAAGSEIVGITKDTDAQNTAITKLGFMPDVDRFYVDRKFIGDTRWQLSKNEMVEIYKNMQNPKAIKHLTKPKALNGMGFSKTDLAAIKVEVEADPQMKGLADFQFKEWERIYSIVAPIYFMETGKVLPKEAYYSPIMVQKEFLDFEKDNLAQEMYNRYHIDGYIEKGFTMERMAGATQPIKLDAIGNHLYNIRRMQHYVNFALPLKEFKAVMNHPKWREAVTAKKGPVFYSNIKKYYDAVAGTKPAGADEVANKALGFLRTNAGTAMLGFNILTAMRQPLSIFQATAEISLPHILSAIRQIGLDPSGLEKFVYERSAMVKNRRGQFERFMTETEVSLPELLGKPRAPKAVTGRLSIRDRAMGMAIFMDRNTVLTTWKAAYDKVTQTGKTLDEEKIPTKDLEKAAIMEADLAVRRTQPMATVKDLPAWHRSSSWLKMFTMFQNQINNNYNYFAHDIIGKTKAGKITPLQAAQKTLFAYVLPAMLLGMISRGGLPKNKKQIAEDMIAFPTSGLFFAGGIINSMIKGYSNWGVPPLQFAPDLVKAYTSKTWATKGKFGLKGLAEISGIPYNQFARTWKGMQALMAGDTDDWRRLIWSAYSLEKGLPKKVEGGLKVFKRKE